MKLRKLLLPLLLLLLLAALLVGCGKDPPGPVEEVIPEETLLLCDAGNEDFATYNIIYSSYANENVKAMVKDLQTTVKEATGVVLKYSTDTSKLTVEGPHEIIFGKTIRQESVTALEKIDGIAYRIERSGEKILITASDDTMLEAALERFKQLFRASEGKLEVTLGLIKETSVVNALPLMVDGTIPFTVIIPAKGYSDELYDAAKSICSFFEQQITGATFKVMFDDKVAEEADAYEICLGNTNRAASQALYSELDSAFEYRVKIDGNRIVVAAQLDTELVKGVEMLRTDLALALDGTYAGTPLLPKDYGGVYMPTSIAKDFELPDDGDFKGFFDCGKDSYILYYKQVKEQAQYEAYVAKLVATGAKVEATYTLGENLYTLLRHETYTAYLSYLKGQQDLRIYIGSPDDLNPPTTPVTNAKKVTPKLWSFKIDVFAGGADGGMSYAIQLTDGKFLVFDGGYSNSDANSLLEVLKKNKLASQAKPIVAGWFVSHLHGDHYEGLKAMSAYHSDEIEVEAFYYNFPYVPMGDQQTITISSAFAVESAMRKWSSAKLYRKVHSGEVLHFSGADVTVIATLEDVFPASHGDGNDTCTVVQVNIAGQKIMFLGDAMYSESAVMVKLGSEVLKSDIVQFSHHGYSGASPELYVAIDPETVLWPMCILGSSNHNFTNMFKSYYVGRSALAANRWVRESESVKKVIVSGAGTECLTLPYKPKGAKVVDYDAIYAEQKAEYDATH